MRAETRNRREAALERTGRREVEGTAQRLQWDAAATELRAWFPSFERFVAPVTAAMVAAASVRAGGRIVDVASGFGEPALSVARLVGPTGRVVATDLSPAMLSVAAERARAAGLGNVELAVMDAQEPNLAPGRYDAVLCRLGLMFLPRLATALERLGALVVPGGALVAAVWGPAEANPAIALAMGTLTQFLELAPRQAGWGIFELGRAGVLEEAFARSGLERVRCVRVPLIFSWPSPAAFTDYHRSSPLRRLVASEEPGRQAEAWQEVTAAARRVSRGRPLRLPGEVVVVAGHRRRSPTRHSPQAGSSPRTGGGSSEAVVGPKPCPARLASSVATAAMAPAALVAARR